MQSIETTSIPAIVLERSLLQLPRREARPAELQKSPIVDSPTMKHPGFQHHDNLVKRFAAVSKIFWLQRLRRELEAQVTRAHPSLLIPHPQFRIVPVVS
jgi:hypothetical protein